MKKVLVAGATGKLGSLVARELMRRGYSVRALVRDASRLDGAQRPIGKAFAGDVFVGDATQHGALDNSCDGIDCVFSALGAPLNLSLSAAGATYRKIDYEGNKRLLEVARRAQVGKFVYVSLFGAESLAELGYVRAHEDFVRELKASGLQYTVVRPTGFFYTMAEVMKLARRGMVVSIGVGEHRTNPIHEEDLAIVCAGAIEDARQEIAVGGPETYTRRGIAELAFAALGKKPRIVNVPAPVMKLAVAPVKLFDRRLYDFLSFGIVISQQDAVAPATGTRSLKTFFDELARGEVRV